MVIMAAAVYKLATELGLAVGVMVQDTCLGVLRNPSAAPNTETIDLSAWRHDEDGEWLVVHARTANGHAFLELACETLGGAP